MDVEEAKTKENPEVKIAEIVEDIDDTRENTEEIVVEYLTCLMNIEGYGIDDWNNKLRV